MVGVLDTETTCKLIDVCFVVVIAEWSHCLSMRRCDDERAPAIGVVARPHQQHLDLADNPPRLYVDRRCAFPLSLLVYG